jgi:hypothetical protein
MQRIADWLEKLGMSEYAERFAENKIDVSVLRHLTDQEWVRQWRIWVGRCGINLFGVTQHRGSLNDGNAAPTPSLLKS